VQTLPLKPWYREPWPWILMAGPATVIIAGVVTVMLAVQSFDGLVAEDYYKRGLAVNQVLARVERATSLGLQARLTLAAEPEGAVRLDLLSAGGALPSTVTLAMSHPTRAGLDQRVQLLQASRGTYVGRIAPLAPGRWHVILEDTTATWRIRGELTAPRERTSELTAAR